MQCMQSNYRISYIYGIGRAVTAIKKLIPQKLSIENVVRKKSVIVCVRLSLCLLYFGLHLLVEVSGALQLLERCGNDVV